MHEVFIHLSHARSFYSSEPWMEVSFIRVVHRGFIHLTFARRGSMKLRHARMFVSLHNLCEREGDEGRRRRRRSQCRHCAATPRPLSFTMGLEIGAVMDFSRRDRVLREKFTRLEEFVTSVAKPDDGLKPVVQVYEIYGVRKGRTEEEQVRVIFSDGLYFQEGLLAAELIGMHNLRKGAIVRLLEYSLFACSHHELVMKRIVKVNRLEVLLADYRVIGEPELERLNWEEVKEDDWEEEGWIWLDPEEQEFEEEEEPCGLLDMTETITSGAVADINTNPNVEFRPIILQIVDIRLIGNPQSERFRLVLSDGTHLQQAMLATELNDKVKSNVAVRGSIVFLLEYLCTTVQNKRIIIVLDMDVLKREAEIVGNPKVFPSS